jgi:hypothetical protein
MFWWVPREYFPPRRDELVPIRGRRLDPGRLEELLVVVEGVGVDLVWEAVEGAAS